MPDEEFQGSRTVSILGPYFDTYSGTLQFASGERSTFSLSVLYETGDPYKLSNVWECRARALYYHPITHVETGDGSLNLDMVATLSDVFPEAPMGTIYPAPAVINYAWHPAASWGQKLTTHLSVDLARYDSPHFRLVLNWPSKSSPLDAELVFKGTARATGRVDQLVVATISFTAP